MDYHGEDSDSSEERPRAGFGIDSDHALGGGRAFSMFPSALPSQPGTYEGELYSFWLGLEIWSPGAEGHARGSCREGHGETERRVAEMGIRDGQGASGGGTSLTGDDLGSCVTKGLLGEATVKLGVA